MPRWWILHFCCCFSKLPSILHDLGWKSKTKRRGGRHFSQKKTQQVISGQSGVFSVGAPCFHPVTQNTMVPVGWLVCHIDHPMCWVFTASHLTNTCVFAGKSWEQSWKIGEETSQAIGIKVETEFDYFYIQETFVQSRLVTILSRGRGVKKCKLHFPSQ